MPDLTFLLVAGTAVLVGAAVQGGVGLGVGLVAAPVVSMLAPELMPGTMLVVSAVLPLLTIGTEWRHADLPGLSWALLGRLVGTLPGVWVVAVLPAAELEAVVGVMVLVAVALTVRAVRLRATPGTLGLAGLVSGVTGTATSIGGPPIALVYQHAAGPRVRATLAGYFAVGALLSLAALALGGQVSDRQVVAGVALVPFVVAGFLLSRPLRRAVDGERLRAALLVVVTLSGIVLLARSLS
ncbi:TSUP family transporter [Marinactinospora thermotolerans]|uniref:Probable membrane transporter protein n=1 Tax=Marinactinospora thermotolerans DSM 45154 TaxID=1122192 RepID=A0A1T4S6T3_9ACTN|nr:TSUP family transporter [Marinactinospora thermotolerans]SKA23857.1 hypothetical protein SAMN02745673_03258 [Marinactinospora thermotolerans DSM 45154]